MPVVETEISDGVSIISLFPSLFVRNLRAHLFVKSDVARIIVQLESRFYNIYRFIFTIMTTFASVEYQEIEGIFVFTFTGEIDETNADEIFKKIYNIFSGRFIIFNFSGLTYGNSKFLGYVASMYEYI